MRNTEGSEQQCRAFLSGTRWFDHVPDPAETRISTIRRKHAKDKWVKARRSSTALSTVSTNWSARWQGTRDNSHQGKAPSTLTGEGCDVYRRGSNKEQVRSRQIKIQSLGVTVRAGNARYSHLRMRGRIRFCSSCPRDDAHLEFPLIRSPEETRCNRDSPEKSSNQ